MSNASQDWYLADIQTPYVGEIRPGDQVKLRFLNVGQTPPPKDATSGRDLPWQFGGETMWVVVTTNLRPITGYAGVLINRPLAIRASFKDKVSFLPQQVIEIRKLKGTASWLYRGLASVEDFLSWLRR